jgi:hypothetical protein
MTGTGERRARMTATEPTTRCMACDKLPTTIAKVSPGWPSRLPAAAAFSSSAIRALAPLEPPALLAAAQPLADLGAQLLRDFVEAGFHFGHGACRQHVDAGQVSDVYHLDAAGPAMQQADRGVERPAGGR